MKVLLLADQPVDFSIAFANGLAPHAEVVMVAARRHYQSLIRWIDPQVRVELVDWPRHRSLANPGFLRRLTRLIRDERPDVIHLLSNTTLWLNLAVPFWRDVPLVTTVHDVARHPGDRDTGRLPAWGPRLMARLSPDIVVHGAALAADAAEVFGKAPDRVHVLQHPAITRYADLARDDDVTPEALPGFRVLLFGRIFAYKGLDLLVRAEKLLGDEIPGLTLVIAGRGDDPAELTALMGNPGRYDIRHRFIEDREAAALFAEADVVALPYSEGSQSGVLHVAATFGKPIVATDVGELGHTVARGGFGLVVPPGRPEAFAAALARLAWDHALRAELGAAALDWAEGANAPATVGAEAMAMYRGILARRSAAARGHPAEVEASR